MSLDPRTPVLIGAGQFLNKATGLDDALDASSLMAEAIKAAATDAGLTEVPNPDSLRVVGLLCWNYGDPAFVVAERLDRKSTRLNSSHIPLSRMPSSA